MTGGSWAHQVLVFFNQALFPSTSSLTPAPVLDEGNPAQSWELEFEHAIDEEGKLPVTVSNTLPSSAPPSLMRSSSVMPNLMATAGTIMQPDLNLAATVMQPDLNPAATIMQPDLNPAATVIPSISTAMEALALVHGRENTNEPVVDDPGVSATRPKPKPKPR
jgi:hypothetical protein